MTFTGNNGRRGFLRSLGGGFGSLALAAMAAEGAVDPLAPKAPHFPAKAKRVILCWMQGGMSQMDLFDCKERLQREGGKKIPCLQECHGTGLGGAHPAFLARLHVVISG